jgi:biopolymer transport protein ExbD
VKIENELQHPASGHGRDFRSTDFVDEQSSPFPRPGKSRSTMSLSIPPRARICSQLKATLMRLKQNADAARTPPVVTIISDTQAKYSRTIDVLDALAVAKIDNVTFTVAEEE